MSVTGHVRAGGMTVTDREAVESILRVAGDPRRFALRMRAASPDVRAEVQARLAEIGQAVAGPSARAVLREAMS